MTASSESSVMSDQADPATETEICLTGPFALAQLRQLDRLAGLKPVRQQLRAVYFDTPNADIARSGAGLRIRRESGAWVQTLKIEAGAAERIECNHTLRQKTLEPFPEIDPLGLPSIVILKKHGLRRSALQALADPSVLRPVFEVTVTRHQWLLRFDGSAIAVALDLGSVRRPAVKQRLPAEDTAPTPDTLRIQELELELVSGSARSLWLLATEVLSTLAASGFGLEPRSKAERGLAWALPALAPAALENARRVKPDKTTPSDLRFGEVIRHHLEGALTTLARRLVQVQTRIEPEDTHQSRVALRQVRTLLKLLVAAGHGHLAHSLLPQCAALADALGRLRDLDVVMASLVLPILKKMPHDPAINALVESVTRHREKTRGQLRMQLAQRETPVLQCALAVLCEQIPASPIARSSEEFGRTEARRLRKKLQRREERAHSAPSAEADHRLRLAHKALRYAAPVLQDLGAPQDLKAWAKKSAKAQEALGIAHDRATALQTLQDTLQSEPIDAGYEARALAVTEGFLLS